MQRKFDFRIFFKACYLSPPRVAISAALTMSVLVSLSVSAIFSLFLSKLGAVVANAVSIFINIISATHIGRPRFVIIADSVVVFVDKITGSCINGILLLGCRFCRFGILGIRRYCKNHHNGYCKH